MARGEQIPRDPPFLRGLTAALAAYRAARQRGDGDAVRFAALEHGVACPGFVAGLLTPVQARADAWDPVAGAALAALGAGVLAQAQKGS